MHHLSLPSLAGSLVPLSLQCSIVPPISSRIRSISPSLLLFILLTKIIYTLYAQVILLIISCVYCILAGNYCLNVDRSLNIPSNGLEYVVFVRYLLVSHWSINAVAFRCTVWGDLNRCGIFHGFVCHSSLCD